MTQTQSSAQAFSSVSPDVSFPKLEEETLSFWDRQKIFEKTLEATRNAPLYSFYDGPPFATGLPHYGHMLAGTLKDIVPRYWTMKGFHIPRRFGWDCHGLPVEYEINKTHKIEDRKHVLAMGVDKYNALCRGIVQRYSTEWKTSVRRIGRWVDMENAYFTMSPEFMQSVWWVFRQLWDQGLVYEGYKVVKYSVGLSSPLSNFEANQNYKDVQDPALTVAFAAVGVPNEFFLAWTTTPWTLPSNLALAVGADIDYVKVRETESGKTYILAQALLGSTFKDPKKIEVLETLKGSALVGRKYEPLFPFFKDKSAVGAFQVILADHVTTESGTGIVHIAPGFGEEDFAACKKVGIPVVCPVDDDGRFTSEVSELAGKRVKDADKDVITALKAKHLLFKQDTLVHSYPFCYRSDTPLINKAVTTWFVKVEAIKDKLLKNNSKTTWVPDHLRDGRFGNWLENARDWAISRNRFWGTPIPVWKNAEGEMICVGSRAELEKLTGAKVDDLHMEFIDQLTIPSPTGKSPLKRVESVLDCWFESGSMPYAQVGYPFQNKEQFEKGFPAQFIAEGLDQTRGWFYTLMVISSALFDQPAFKNVVVNGLILAEDGKKMSKSLRNYPDPQLVFDSHGADAVRLYMINSPAVKAEELRFSEKGVKDVVRKILLRWWNSYSFFVSYANIDGFRPRGDYAKSPNLLDQWILSRLNSLIESTNREMAAYRLYNVVPRLLEFIEELTNTYIRFNRRHFWEDGMPESKRLAYETLFHTLATLSKVMAPFAPFLADTIYRNLATATPGARESVHLERFPEAELSLVRPELEEAVGVMEILVNLGRAYREQVKTKAKIPLQSMRILHRKASVLENLKRFEPYFEEELNIRSFEYDTAEDRYVQISAKANFVTLGKRLGPKMKAVAAKIQALTLAEIGELEKGRILEIEGEKISLTDVEIRRASKDGTPHVMAHQRVSFVVDPTVTPEQIREGIAREIVRKIQQTRKNARLKLDDRIHLEVSCDGDFAEAFRAHEVMIRSETLSTSSKLLDGNVSGSHTETFDFDGEKLYIGVRVQR
jgi:isoleucyl-tRNA synthetase